MSRHCAARVVYSATMRGFSAQISCRQPKARSLLLMSICISCSANIEMEKVLPAVQLIGMRGCFLSPLAVPVVRITISILLLRTERLSPLFVPMTFVRRALPFSSFTGLRFCRQDFILFFLPSFYCSLLPISHSRHLDALHEDTRREKKATTTAVARLFQYEKRSGRHTTSGGGLRALIGYSRHPFYTIYCVSPSLQLHPTARYPILSKEEETAD